MARRAASSSGKSASSASIEAIVGTDTFLAEEILDRVLEGALGEDRQEGLQVLYGDETTWERLVAVAQTGSLFAPRRAIVVRRADQLKGDEERIAAYADDPSPEVTLVLMAPKPVAEPTSTPRLRCELSTRILSIIASPTVVLRPVRLKSLTN